MAALASGWSKIGVERWANSYKSGSLASSLQRAYVILEMVLTVAPNMICKPPVHRSWGSGSLFYLWPQLGTFGPKEFCNRCLEVALQEDSSVLVVPFSLWKQRGLVSGGNDRAGFPCMSLEPCCFFSPHFGTGGSLWAQESVV